MPYSRSAARDEFSGRVAGLRKTFRYAKVRPKSLPADIRILTFHAAVFHLSAAFEDYLFQVLSSWMYQLQKRKKPVGHLPSRLRNLLYLKANEGTLRNFIVTGAEKEALEKMEGSRSGLDWFDIETSIPQYRFYATIINEKKFPTPDNIEALIARFGYLGVIAEMSRRMKSDVALKMRSFIDVRNSIAHESPTEFTEGDLEDYFSSISDWVATLDRILCGHVLTVSGRDCWQT